MGKRRSQFAVLGKALDCSLNDENASSAGCRRRSAFQGDIRPMIGSGDPPSENIFCGNTFGNRGEGEGPENGLFPDCLPSLTWKTPKELHARASGNSHNSFT